MNTADLRQNKESSMDGFMRWYTKNYTEITWFLIGWLSVCALDNFGKGRWFDVLLDVGLVVLNYVLYKNSK